MKNWNFKSRLKLTAPFLSLCLIMSCGLFHEEDEPKTELEKLPPITTTGENTFGCLVNGKAWVPETSVDFAAFYQQGLFFIGADFESPDQSIGIFAVDGEELLSIIRFMILQILQSLQQNFLTGQNTL